MKARKLDYQSPPPPKAKKLARYSYWPAGIPALITLAIAFIQAGPQSGMLAYRLIADASLAAFWLMAMTGIGWPITRNLTAPFLLRIVTAAALGTGIVSLLILGLGLAGWLNRITAWLILLAGIAAGAYWLWQSRQILSSPSPGTPGEGRVRASSPWNWLWLLITPFLGLSIVGAIVPPGLLWQDEPAGYDVAEYHLQIPREWYEAHKITPLNHNVFSYMPMNVEMHDLLAMHLRGGPWAGMYLAQFIHVAIMILAVLAAAGIAAALSDKPWAGPLAGIAMGVVPWITSLAPIAYNEGGLMLFSTLAIGWTLIAKDWRGWMIAGAMAGLACGVKLTAAPMVVVSIAVAWIAVSIFRTRANPTTPPSPSHPHLARNIAIFALTTIALFSPWLIRNQIWAGNPVFPEAMEFLGKGHFSDAQVQRWRTAYQPTELEKKPTERLATAWQRIAIDWRYGYLFLPLTLAAIVLLRDRPAAFLAILLVLHLIIWLAFTHLQGRFYILAIPIGAILIGIVREKQWPWIAGSLITVIAILSFLILNDRYSMVRELAVADTSPLGVEDLTWIVNKRSDFDLEKLPQDRTIILAGDAQAFDYSSIPMTRLKYRTVFDVPAPDAGDWLEKWTGGAHGTVLVFPGELLRLKRSYFNLPTPDENTLKTQPPYTLEK